MPALFQLILVSMAKPEHAKRQKIHLHMINTLWSFRWQQNFISIMDSVEDYISRWAKSEKKELHSLSEWVKSIRAILKSRIKSKTGHDTSIHINQQFEVTYLFNDIVLLFHTILWNLLTHSMESRSKMRIIYPSAFNKAEVITELNKLHEEYILVPADKTCDSIVLIINELGINSTIGNRTYTPTTFSKDEIL
jgi:hypothetical protein